MPPDKARAARRMYEVREMTVQQIADVLGVGRSSVYRSLRLQGVVAGFAPVSEVVVDVRG